MSCDACVVAVVSARDTGGVVECVCGDRHGGAAGCLRKRPNASRAPASPTRGRPERVWRGDADHVPGPVSPLARAGALAKVLAPEDVELSRVRTLLADLRPDCADPWEPPPADAREASFAPMPRDPTASHGGIPRGYGSGSVYQPPGVPLSDVLEEVDALPEPHAAVLRWARTTASLGQGLRGLYVDAGMWAAVQGMAPDGTLALWNTDIAARRKGAYSLGRWALLRAATAWRR